MPTTKTKKSFDFTLGADPEFTPVVLESNKQIHMDRLLSKLCDTIQKAQISSKMGYKTEGGYLGHDGCSSTAEIRPNPADNPADLVENIRLILKEYAKLTEGKINALTCSVFAPVGGHIHLAQTDEVKKMDEKSKNRMLRQVLSMLVPLLISNSKSTDNRRNPYKLDSGYGKLTDYRVHEPGQGVLTFEIRAPSAEWLTTPKIAEATLAYLAICYHEAIHNPKSFNRYMRGLIAPNMDNLNHVMLLRKNQPTLFKKYCGQVTRAIKHFERYPDYAELIDYVLDTKQVLADKEAIKYDILAGWGLQPESVTDTDRPSYTVLDTETVRQLDIENVLKIIKDDSWEKHKTNAIYELINGSGVSLPSCSVPIRANDNDTGLTEIASSLSDLASRYATLTDIRPRTFVYLYGLREGTKNEIHVSRYAGNADPIDLTQNETALDTQHLESIWNRLSTFGMGRNGTHIYAIGIPYAMRTDGIITQGLIDDLFAKFVTIQNGGLNPNPTICAA